MLFLVWVASTPEVRHIRNIYLLTWILVMYRVILSTSYIQMSVYTWRTIMQIFTLTRWTWQLSCWLLYYFNMTNWRYIDMISCQIRQVIGLTKLGMRSNKYFTHCLSPRCIDLFHSSITISCAAARDIVMLRVDLFLYPHHQARFNW